VETTPRRQELKRMRFLVACGSVGMTYSRPSQDTASPSSTDKP
jgi:hypothetical protein